MDPNPNPTLTLRSGKLVHVDVVSQYLTEFLLKGARPPFISLPALVGYLAPPFLLSCPTTVRPPPTCKPIVSLIPTSAYILALAGIALALAGSSRPWLP